VTRAGAWGSERGACTLHASCLHNHPTLLDSPDLAHFSRASALCRASCTTFVLENYFNFDFFASLTLI
jgi:hypothetical protein